MVPLVKVPKPICCSFIIKQFPVVANPHIVGALSPKLKFNTVGSGKQVTELVGVTVKFVVIVVIVNVLLYKQTPSSMR